MIAVYITVLALFMAIALVPLLIHWASPLGLVDEPGPRKIHDHAVPRVGGIAISVGALASILVWVDLRPEFTGYLLGAVVISVFGGLDDRFDLDYRLKFLGQIGGALLCILIGDIQLTRVPFMYEAVMPGWVGLPLTVVVVVAITNAVNLSDGMDGLAGSTSLAVAAMLGYLAYLGGDKLTALLALSVIGATIGFLRYNTFPARVFMGDAGSQFLGFSMAVLGIIVTERSNTAISPLVPVLVLGLPILDMLYVITRRIREGQSPFKPDRHHLHHRLLDAGLSQYGALLAIYALQAALMVLAWLFRYAHDLVLLGVFGAFSAALLLALNWWQTQHTEGRALAHRLNFVDALVNRLKAKDVLRRVGHQGVLYGVSLLFPVVAVWVKFVPPDIGWLALLLAAAALIALLPIKLLPCLAIFRMAAFVTAVIVVYLMEFGGLRGSGEVDWLRAYLLLIAFLVAIWLRFGGGEFHLNALDVLVILIVAIVPNMPMVREFDIGPMVIETLLLFYASELILSERPARWWVFRVSLLFTLGILAVRGLLFPGG